mmetsp:Transcript_13819/g.34535  ORF Transcript_13819/g.34535 Transcript_13819/m.34535 type:complete len:242 (-) Transcript_13819:966-1691(-)
MHAIKQNLGRMAGHAGRPGACASQGDATQRSCHLLRTSVHQTRAVPSKQAGRRESGLHGRTHETAGRRAAIQPRRRHADPKGGPQHQKPGRDLRAAVPHKAYCRSVDRRRVQGDDARAERRLGAGGGGCQNTAPEPAINHTQRPVAISLRRRAVARRRVQGKARMRGERRRRRVWTVAAARARLQCRGAISRSISGELRARRRGGHTQPAVPAVQLATRADHVVGRRREAHGHCRRARRGD